MFSYSASCVNDPCCAVSVGVSVMCASAPETIARDSRVQPPPWRGPYSRFSDSWRVVCGRSEQRPWDVHSPPFYILVLCPTNSIFSTPILFLYSQLNVTMISPYFIHMSKIMSYFHVSNITHTIFFKQDFSKISKALFFLTNYKNLTNLNEIAVVT